MMPLALFLLGCAAVYLGTIESAFNLLMRLSLRLLAERGGRRADLGRFLDEPILLFLPVRLLLGMVIATATALVAILAGGSAVHVIAVAVLATVAAIVVCVHIVPLVIVRRNPERVLEALLPSFGVLTHIMRPVTAPLIGIVAERRDRAEGPAASGESEAESAEAASAYLAAGEQEGLIEGDERRLLQSIVDFGDTLVREVMTPRPDIVAIGAHATLPELRALLREQGYSRMPVFKDSLDNILGFVFVKDVIQVPEDGAAPGAVAALMRPAYFVPETKRVSDLLKEFQRQQVQIAIVVDEGEGVFLVSGKAAIDAVSERLGVTIEREGFDSIGGYVLSRLGRVPAVGEALEMDGLGVEVVDAERRRVHKVRIRRLPGQPADAEPA